MLTDIKLPSGLTVIGANAFENCIKLKQVTLPDGFERLGFYAFYGCAKLESVTVSESLNYIGNSAFEGCYWLSDINFRGTQGQWDAINKGAFWKPSGIYKVNYSYSGE
jgi:hypothetical protein